MNFSAPPRPPSCAAPNADRLGRPKIIFVNRVFWPNEAATAQLLTDLATALAARGWDVHVIASGTEAGEHHGVTIHRTGAEPASRLGRYTHFLLGARRLLRALVTSGDVVVLKTDPPLLAVAATALARSRGARVVQWIQDIYPEIVPLHVGAWAALPLAPLRLSRNRAWRASNACLAVSDDMRATVLDAGVATERAHTFANWAPQELDTPAAPDTVAAVRAAWGIRPDDFLVAYSGNLGRVHEFETALAAAAALRDEPRVRFAFIGGGRRLREVQAAVAARALTNVTFLPPRPRSQLAASLAAADAHLVTLLPGYERLVAPSKLAGVLAAARPALFVGPTDCGIAAQLKRDACGASFAPGDAAGLAAVIRAWHADDPGRQSRQAAARAAYAARFRFADAVERWDGFLRADAADPRWTLPAPARVT